MKRILTILLLILSVSTSIMAQANLIATTSNIEVGQVEWNKPIVVEFTVSNNGNQLLFINEVFSSCGCAEPQWSKSPIEPGNSAVIGVEFDAKALGKFHKEISIYSNSEPNIVYLTFTGEVVRKITDFTSTHPIKIGNIRLDRDTLDFGEVYSGEEKKLEILFVNESSSIYRPVLMHKPEFIEVVTSGDIVAKGNTGKFEVTVNAKEYKNYGKVYTEMYLSRFEGDKVSEENKIPISFLLLPQVSRILNGSPKMELDYSKFYLSEKLKTKEQAKGYISISNESSRVLDILKVQTFSPAVSVKLKKSKIVMGKPIKLHVTVDKRKMLTPQDDLSILLLTNDVNHKVLNINIK